MTNLEAIKAELNYPLPDNSYLLALEKRGLDSSGTFSSDNNKALELAKADLMFTLVTTPNIEEGGYKVALRDKDSMMKFAQSIYSKYGETGFNQPTAKVVNPW